MLGRRGPRRPELFVTGPLEDLIPEDHILVRVDRVLDLSWLRKEVAGCYADDGRPGIDPEVAVRLMLAGFLLGVVQDRRLMREAQVNLAIRWFVGYGLQEKLPDHSSLTRIRQRWGATRFQRIFQRTVEACVDAGVATGEVVHVDATLIRADVSWESLAERHVEAALTANSSEAPPSAEEVERRERERLSKQSGRYKKRSRTDPDASMATTRRGRRLEPSYKQHTAVDDRAGVVLDVTITTGEINEGGVLDEQLGAIEHATGRTARAVTADAGYACGKVYRALEVRGVKAVIPPKAEPGSRGVIPLRRFRYDPVHRLVRCPRGRKLKRVRHVRHGWYYRASARDCGRCPVRGSCITEKVNRRQVVVSDAHEALLRARRRRHRWSDEERHLYRRHRWRVEGVHGEAKTRHGLARAVRRGLDNMAIQAYLTAASINLKRLAAFIWSLLSWWLRPLGRRNLPRCVHAPSPGCNRPAHKENATPV